MAAAIKLLETGQEVTILERSDYVGGLAASNRIIWDGVERRIPKNYHHILEDDKFTFDILKKVGIYDKLYWKKINFAFFINGGFNRISTPMGFLTFPAPLSEKIKFGLLVLKTTFRKDWTEWEKYNTKQFVEKEVGPAMYEKLIKPLQTFKFGEDPDAMSAAWFANRLGGEAKNFLKKFGYIDGGLDLMIENMEKTIRVLGGNIILEAEVSGADIFKDRVNGISYVKDGQEHDLACDAIISSLPSKPNISIFGLKDPNLSKVKYRGSICLTFGTNKVWLPYYWSMLLDPGFPFGAIFTHSNLYPKAAPQGKAVMYAVDFYDQNDPVWKLPEEKIVEEFKSGLERVFPGFNQSIEWMKVSKEFYSEPIYEKNYKEYNPSMKTSIKNLVLCGTAFIFPRIRNMSASIESGYQASAMLLESVKNVDGK